MHVDLPQQENAVAIDPIVLKRVDRFIDHLSCNANGDYEIDDVVRVLIGAGLERPVVEHALRSHVEGEAIGRSAIPRSELHGLMCAHLQADIGRMSYFDKMYEATPQERQAVGASRLMIESRIDYMTQSVKAGDTERRVSFDILHLVTIVFFFIIDLLYNLTYFDREPMDVYWAIVAIHGVWLLDVAWNVALPAVDAQGVVVTNPWDVILCKWRILAIDVVALLPIDLVLYWFCSEKAPETFLPNDNHPHLVAFLVWRLIKLIKVARLKSLFAFVTLDVVTPRFVTIFFLLKPLVHIAAATVMTIHIVTCICLHVLKEDFSLPPQFDYLNQLVDVVSMLTASGPNVGYSGPASQPVLLTLMACGLIAQAAVISNLSVTVFRNDVAAMNIQQMRETLSILEHFRVPKDVSTEILSYQLHALNDDVSQRLSTLRTLPVAMQQEVLLYVKVAAVNTVKLFTKASHDCKMKIAELLVQTVVPPTTDIVAIGDVGEEMFLIAHGYASVIIFNGMTVAMLSRGDYFGEVALLLPNNIRQATVRALTYCDLWVLDKHSFLEILTKFPGLMLAMEGNLAVSPPSVLSGAPAHSNEVSNDASRRGSATKSMPWKKRLVSVAGAEMTGPTTSASRRPTSLEKRRMTSSLLDFSIRPSISSLERDPHVAAMAPFMGEELFVGRKRQRGYGAESNMNTSRREQRAVSEEEEEGLCHLVDAGSDPTSELDAPIALLDATRVLNTDSRPTSPTPQSPSVTVSAQTTADEVQQLRDALRKAIELVQMLSHSK